MTFHSMPTDGMQRKQTVITTMLSTMNCRPMFVQMRQIVLDKHVFHSSVFCLMPLSCSVQTLNKTPGTGTRMHRRCIQGSSCRFQCLCHRGLC